MAEPRDDQNTDDEAVSSETGSQQNVDRDITSGRNLDEQNEVRGGSDQNQDTDPDAPDADIERDDRVTE